MTRRRSSARALVSLLIIGLVVAACDGAVQSTLSSAPSTSGAPSVAPSSDPGSSVVPSDSAEPSEQPTTSDEPSGSPSEEPSAEPSGDASGSPDIAAACAGTTKNREFFVLVAEAVAWPLYCPVLPAGWNVTAGQWRQAGGGRMEIGYKGPGGARIDLAEGAFCADANGCVPPGTEIGDTAFADRTAMLVAADDGSWAVVVDQGSNPSWLLTATGLDETEVRAIAAALIEVGG